MENENYPQIFLEECKYKIKKAKISKFINTELESESQSGSESKSDAELMILILIPILSKSFLLSIIFSMLSQYIGGLLTLSKLKT